jgi:hypothetical protein
VAVVASSCEEPQEFVEPSRHTQRFLDLTNVEFTGQQQEVYRVTVLPEPDMVHPHFEGRWTFADPERPIDFYVIPAAYYDPNALGGEQDSIFWSSVADADVGQQRLASMHLHPTPGDWVVVLYNALPFGPTTRARFSTELDLTYFR